MVYDNKSTELDIEVNKLTGWLNIDIIENESEDDLQKRIQEEIDKQYNRPDYNNWHRHDRHIGYSKAISEDGEEAFNHFKEPLMSEVKDDSIFFKEQLAYEKQKEYDSVCNFIRSVYPKKPALVEVMIQVWIDDFTIQEAAESKVIRTKGMSDKEYQRLVVRKANNLSKALNRAKEKFKKVLQKTSDFDIPRGYLVEVLKSSNNK